MRLIRGRTGTWHIAAEGERKHFAAPAPVCNPWNSMPFAEVLVGWSERPPICKRCLKSQEARP